MKNCLCVLIVSLLAPAAACAASSKRSDDLERTLQDAFRAIYLSHFGLDFPADEDRANRCYVNRDEPCLRTFERVMDAKRYIVAQARADPGRVLQITLDTVFQYGDMISDPASRTAEGEGFFEASTCDGAIIAFYFFDRDEQDRKILDRLKSASPKVLERLFVTYYEWHYNRPDPQRWIAFVEALPERSFSAPFKKDTKDSFRNTTRKRFGLMLDPPPNAIRFRASGSK
jgi:hypothetical protein